MLCCLKVEVLLFITIANSEIDSGLAFRRGEGGERAKRRKREIRLKYLETGRDKVELLSNK